MSRAPTDPLGEHYCELAQPWEASADRSPYENLWALMRAVEGYPPISEISATAYRYIPGLGDTDTHIVERIYDEFAEEHALARAEQWMSDREELPTITVPDARTRPEDDGTRGASDIVRATVEYRLARSSRSCLDHDPDSVIDCAGPDGSGYCCPACCQQRRREDAIIDALLAVWNDETDESTPDKTSTIDPGERTPAATATDGGTVTETNEPTTEETDEDPASTDRSDSTGQSALDAFASGNGGGDA
jgi:hypothetical protein